MPPSQNSRTTVVHCRLDAFDVYIGRAHPLFPAGSPWGNPFKVGVDGSLPQVLERYRSWIREQPELMARLPELRGKRIACWCKTRKHPNAPCHGDILALLADGAPAPKQQEQATLF